MSRDNIKTIGLVMVFVALAVLVIFHDDIKTMLNGAMVEQADSLMDQLLR